MFYPMFAMVILTFIVALYLLASRIMAVKQRQVSIGYFRQNNGTSEPPAKLVVAGRHYTNLFEVPLLFYITCLTAMVMGFQQGLIVIFAWLFVATRVVHSLIHLTSNNVLHRMLAFVAGVVCVLVMWLLLVAHYAAR